MKEKRDEYGNACLIDTARSICIQNRLWFSGQMEQYNFSTDKHNGTVRVHVPFDRKASGDNFPPNGTVRLIHKPRIHQEAGY